MARSHVLQLIALVGVLACNGHTPDASLRSPLALGLAALTQKAEDRWYAAICRTPTHTAIRVVPPPMKCGLILDAWGCRTHGDMLWLAADLPAQHLEQVMVHEMGHTFNVDHVLPFEGIQASNFDEALPYITAADIDLVCRERDCPCRRPEQP